MRASRPASSCSPAAGRPGSRTARRAGRRRGGLLCERLREASRLDLACHIALYLVRGAWAAGAGGPVSTLPANAAGKLFEVYSRYLWDESDDHLLREKGLVGHSQFSALVTYPVRCVRIAEMVALLSLRVRETDPSLSADIAEWITQFASAQPGVAHPISDQYVASLIPRQQDACRTGGLGRECGARWRRGWSEAG